MAVLCLFRGVQRCSHGLQEQACPLPFTRSGRGARRCLWVFADSNRAVVPALDRCGRLGANNKVTHQAPLGKSFLLRDREFDPHDEMLVTQRSARTAHRRSVGCPIKSCHETHGRHGKKEHRMIRYNECCGFFRKSASSHSKKPKGSFLGILFRVFRCSWQTIFAGTAITIR
jgi:hypothetical protein